VQAIREVRRESQERLDRAIEQEKVREAWETGRLIDAHVLGHKERAAYGMHVLERLSKDLGMSSSELRYMLRFARAYPIRPTSVELTWGHYRELLSVNDAGERQDVAESAVKENWTVKETRKNIQQEHSHGEVTAGPGPLEPPKLNAKPGKLYTYRVTKAPMGPLAGQYVIDLGFSNYFQPEGLGKFREGDIITFRDGKPEVLKDAGENDLYTYRAYVMEVLDGDTFRAAVDLGFKFTTVQDLRLRGIDAPVIQGAEGRRAKAFVESWLKDNQGVVLVRTVKSDKYDRYLADVFLPDGAEGGKTRYLNQELLDEGLAVKVEG